MKKLFTLALFFLACTIAQAQDVQQFGRRSSEHVAQLPTFRSPSPAAIVFDTIFFSSRERNRPCGQDTGLTFYTLVGGGNASGTNSSGFREFGQKFRHRGTFKVLGALMALNLENATNPDIFVNAYPAANRRVGTITFIDTAGRKQSDPSPLSTLINNRYNTFNFSDTTNYSDSVILAITIPPGANGDTLISFTTAVGCLGVTGKVDAYTLQRGQRGLLPISQRITGFTVDMAMAAIIEFDNTPVKNLPSLASSATQVFPVPAADEIVVVLPKNVSDAGTWDILTMDGKVARSGTFNSVTTTIERGGLSGVYTLRMNTTVGPITKRVVFQN